MVQQEISNLKLWMSYVTPELLDKYIKYNILPIFIARNISNSGLIGKWQRTSVHFPEFAPSPDLLREWKNGKITTENFDKAFSLELGRLDIQSLLKKIQTMCVICNAPSAVLLGYGEDPLRDHRHVVKDYINSLGILSFPITEVQL